MIYAFGEFELDESLYELRRSGEVVRLAPKVFDVLRYLIRHRDRVIPKRELLDELWRGEAVSESVLPTNINAVRRALGDERRRAEMIQTLHGRGYRFVAGVETRQAGVAHRAEGTEGGPAFVGREGVMTELRATFEDALAGSGRLVLLVGEPGIGKTRTAEELATDARRGNAWVLSGRCYEGEGAPAYWPWVQLLRSAVRESDAAALRSAMGRGAADIAQLVPELRDALPDLATPPAVESDLARFRLFDSVATFLRNASQQRPLVLFLDDLHWADEPTLLLLQFLAGELRGGRVLLIGAYRDVEVRRHHPLAAVLGELARQPNFQRISLRGLSQADVGRFVAAATGSMAPEGLVGAIHEMTEGNPFFLHETVRLLAAEGRLKEPEAGGSWTLTLPEGVRDVIGRRLDRLPAECNNALALASVIGREFGLNVLERIAELPRETLLDLLDEAVEAGILVESPRDDAPRPIGHYAFSHALIRETLYEELSGPERVRLHRRVGEVLEAAYGADSQAHLAELAHHFYQAAPGGDAARAIGYAERAARKALELLAYEESVEHYQRALQALEFTVPTDDVRGCELTLELGWAALYGGRPSMALPSFRRAAEIARRIGRPDLLGRAAMGLGGWPLSAGMGPIEENLEFRAAVEEALPGIGEDSLALRARLISGLAVTPPDQNSMQRRKALSEQAMELARRCGDADALFDALYARLHALLGPDDAAQRLEVAAEFLALAEKTGAKEKLFTAYENRVRTLMLTGDLAAADRDIEACEQLADEMRVTPYRYSASRYRAARALAAGRFDEAEQLLDRAEEFGRRASDPGRETVVGLHRAWLLSERGRLAEIEPFFESFVEELAWASPLPEGLIARFYALLGRDDEARRYYERVAAQGFAHYERDEHWLARIALAGEVCSDLADAVRAPELYALLEPYAALLMGHQTARFAVGSLSHVLGRLAALCGRPEQATRHFEAALETNARLGMRPALARTRYEYGRFLLGGAREGAPSAADRRRAHELLAGAQALAEELGMQELVGKLRGLA